MASLVLSIQEPGRDIRKVDVRVGLRIGRHPDNDCVLHDGKTSAWHAEVVDDGSGGFVIRDLGSSNGTKILGGPELGGQQVYPLVVGTSIVIGRCNIDVAVAAPIAATTIMPAMNLDAEPSAKASPSSESKTTGRPIPKTSDESATDSQAAVDPDGESPVAPGDQDKTDSQAIVGPDPNDVTRLATPAMADPLAAQTQASAPAMPDPKAEDKTPEEEPPAANKTRVMAAIDILAEANDAARAGLDGDDDAPPADSATPSEEEDAATKKRNAARAAAIKKAAAKKKAASESGADKAPAAKKKPAAESGADGAAGDAAAKKAAAKKAAVKKAAAKKAAAKKVAAAEESEEEKAPPKLYNATVAISAAKLMGRPEDIAAIRPRIILDNYGKTEVLEVLSGDFTIGRKTADRSDTYGVIDSPSVSTRHARIRFMEGRFFIEDCGSKNGTLLDGKPMALMNFKELQPDTPLVFGNVKGLYVSDLMADGSPVNPNRYAAAAEALERRGFLTKSEREQAAKRGSAENRHIGEVLILDRKIGIEQWAQAVSGGQIARDVKSASRAAKSRLLIIGGIIIILGCVLAWFLMK
ncbi:MAG: FHA domain-containing protein [Planctomycetota bacterium]